MNKSGLDATSSCFWRKIEWKIFQSLQPFWNSGSGSMLVSEVIESPYWFLGLVVGTGTTLTWIDILLLLRADDKHQLEKLLTFYLLNMQWQQPKKQRPIWVANVLSHWINLPFVISMDCFWEKNKYEYLLLIDNTLKKDIYCTIH